MSCKDGVLDISRRSLTEVTERSDVSVLGIHPESQQPLPELVSQDISTELNSTKRSTESAKEKEEELRTTPLLMLMSPKRTSLLLEDSLTTVLSRMISLSLRDAVLVQRRDSFF